MKLETFNKELSDGVRSLLKMAREMCYNNISDNLTFVIRKVDNEYSGQLTIPEMRKMRKKLNDSKPLLTFDQAIKELKQSFEDIYEIDLYVYRAEKNRTTIEIEVTEKDKNRPIYIEVPDLHCKVAIPPYAHDYTKNTTEKFNINWELGTWDSRWKMFWWRLRTGWELKRELKTREKRAITNV